MNRSRVRYSTNMHTVFVYKLDVIAGLLKNLKQTKKKQQQKLEVYR